MKRSFHIGNSSIDGLVQFPLKERSLYFSLDGKGRIFRYLYSGEASDVYDFMGALIIDARLDDLINSLSQNFLQLKKDTNIDLDSFTLDQALIDVRRALLSLNGDTNFDYGTDLLCRCSRVSCRDFEDAFVEFSGDFKEVARTLKTSIACGTCKDDAVNLFKELEKKNLFFKGRSKIFWLNRFSEAMLEFPMFSPAEFHGVRLEVAEVTMPNVEIKASGETKNLNVDFAIKTLKEFLKEHIEEDYNLDLTIGD